MTTNYKPRFRPEVYLRFLNQRKASIQYLVDGNTNKEVPIIGIRSASGMFMPFHGEPIEEALDQAIIATKFEEEL